MPTSEKILRIMFFVLMVVVSLAAGQSVINQIGKSHVVSNVCSILLGYLSAILIVASSFAFGMTMLSDDNKKDKE